MLPDGLRIESTSNTLSLMALLLVVIAGWAVNKAEYQKLEAHAQTRRADDERALAEHNLSSAERLFALEFGATTAEIFDGQQMSAEEWPERLVEVAQHIEKNFQDWVARFGPIISKVTRKPRVQALKEVKPAIEVGEYDRAERPLNEAGCD